MALARVGLVGASGYAGAVAARLLAAHPAVELSFCTSDKLAGQRVGEALGLAQASTARDGAHPHVGGSALRFVPNATAETQARGCDVVVLATSAEVSARLAPALQDHAVVLDLSGAFRLDALAYPRWYGFEHPAPALLARAHYGLPELFGAPPAGTRVIANPGCYPTAALLALAPLVRAGLLDVEASSIVVDAKSGVTGAGRQAREDFSFGEVAGDVRAYKVLAHQHTPEIARGLGLLAGVTFTAHLLPVRRGLLATCYGRPRPGTTEAIVRECLADAYASAAFVRAVAPGDVTLKSVAGTNLARVGATANADVVVAIGAIDNLVKGAAGQAVQNLNLLLGLGETAGLDGLARFAP